jgi:hypothetical protein
MNLQGRDLTQGLSGPDVAELQKALSKLGFAVPAAEQNAANFGVGTLAAVKQFQSAQGLQATGVVDSATSAGLGDAILLSTFAATGTVTSPTRAGVGGLAVQLVDKNVGGDVVLASGVTNGQGDYNITVFITPRSLLERHKKTPDLQVRVSAGNKFLASSAVRYNAPLKVQLDVTLRGDAAGLPSEYETLTTELSAVYPGRLSALQETDQRQDITFLANKTGWDARGVAMAALADQFSDIVVTAPMPQSAAPGHSLSAAATSRPPEISGRIAPAARGVPKSSPAPTGTPSDPNMPPLPASVHLKPELYYALFRAGLPANADTLFQASAKTVEGVWKQAVAQAVIPPIPDDEIVQAVQSYQLLSATHSLTATLPIGPSTLSDMLKDVLPDAGQQQQFAQLYAQNQHDRALLWKSVQDTFGASTTSQLQFHGQLYYLTLNNRPLVSALAAAEKQAPLAAVGDLVTRGYYDSAKWLPLIGNAIPAEVPGADADQQRGNYAQLLASQVRLAFPTTVLADLVRRGSLPLADQGTPPGDVADFLTANQGKFEIGIEPVEAYIARTGLAGTAAPVVTEIKRLQRLYQLTPDDQSMMALLQHGFDSAYAIARHDADAFVRTTQGALGSEAAAARIHSRARQIYNVALNVATSYLVARRAPALGGNSPIHVPFPQAPANPSYPVIAYPTLEGLFGSLDYCDCDECRSILSPAAYLVDLLNSLDIPTASPGYQNPQAVLLQRRPDLQYLPLTCENTNNALPYIDIVNETLEYFVVNHLTLNNFEGFDTGPDVTSDELLANPQNVNQAAYTALEGAFFPPPLPFNRSLSQLRLHLQKIGVALPDVMAALRPSDAIERGDAAYGWRDILMEQLSISRQEYRVFADGTLKLQGLYGYPGLSDGAVLSLLQTTSLETFSRRTGVSYEDLFSIVQTRFINPYANLIPRLERLNASFAGLQQLKKGVHDPAVVAAFKAGLPAGLDARDYGGANAADTDAVINWVTSDKIYARIMRLIVITDPTGRLDQSSASALQFRYSDPNNRTNLLTATDFVKLIRFIRLWQKLGFSISQTDAILTALFPADHLPVGAKDAVNLRLLDAGFHALLPRVGFLMQIMKLLSLNANDALLPLLACWAPVDTTGTGSLYAGMFLSRTLAQSDPAFADDGSGNFLDDPAEPLMSHAATLCAAFNITGAEFDLMTGASVPGALNFNEATGLTLANISAIYRIGWLAHTLRISVLELLLWRSMTGLDPFAPLDPAAKAPAEPAAIRFIRQLQALGAAGLSPTQALYLLWDKDISGNSAPTDAAVTELALALRADFAAVDAQFTLVDDPDGSIAKGLMTLVYGSAATDFFFGLINGTMSTTVACAAAQAELPAAIVTASGGRLVYDDLRKQLSFSGVLDAATAATIDQVITANGDDAALHAAVAELAVANQQNVTPFFASYPELQPLYSAYVTAAGTPQDRRTALLANFLPALKQKRKQEQALASITGGSGTDPSFASALLQDVALLHASADASLAAYADVTAIESQGLSARFFLGNDPVASPDQSLGTVADLDYLPSSNPLPPGNGAGPIAAIFDGYINVPQDGYYNILVTTDAGANVTLAIASTVVAMAADGGTWKNQAPIFLRAGTLTAAALTATSLQNTFSVMWETTGTGRQAIPGQYLYSATLVNRLRATYIAFLKATSLASALGITANEIANFASATAFPNIALGWLNLLLPSQAISATTNAGLGDVLTALLDFARIKAAVSPTDERLLEVMKTPTQTLPDGSSALLALMGWSESSVDALLQQFFGNTAFAPLSSIENLRRVYEAYALVTACRITGSALIGCTTNAPTATIVATLQSALRALYAEPDWLTEIRQINDTMRIQQRDALVAYILQQFGDGKAQTPITLATRTDTLPKSTMVHVADTAKLSVGMLVSGPHIVLNTSIAAIAGNSVRLTFPTLASIPAGTPIAFVNDTATVNTADKLFEYFLLDVQTQPPVETSRIRLALSSVQLFIERVMRNLEPQVLPSDLSVLAACWTWMKRYRVWQANREVFLWPENWLTPELRDDQSPLFQQTMSDLLQGDITDDAAAAAYLDYLSGLEEVAKLEPCGLYYAPGTADSDEVSYVVARTAGATRKYFFRMLQYGSWTPWTEVKIECEDLPLTPVVWNGRLFLFWLKIIKQGASSTGGLLANIPDNSSSDQSDQDKTKISNLKTIDLQKAADAQVTDQSQVQVSAMLNWTEYYNGKWQPTKTSDVARPTLLGTYPAAGEDSFDAQRNLVQITPAVLKPGAPFTISSDALILAIGAQNASSWPSGGFVLYNTHSLPVRFDDIGYTASASAPPFEFTLHLRLTDIIADPSSGRTLAPVKSYTGANLSATFGVSYWVSPYGPSDPNYANDLIKFDWSTRFVEPQRGLPDAWNAPFFYEDRQHAFYVTTTDQYLSLASFNGYGVLTAKPGSSSSIPDLPPLTCKKPPVSRSEADSIVTGNAIGHGYSTGIQAYLSRSQTIRTAIGNTDPMSYQGRTVYPGGSISDVAQPTGKG